MFKWVQAFKFNDHFDSGYVLIDFSYYDVYDFR